MKIVHVRIGDHLVRLNDRTDRLDIGRALRHFKRVQADPDEEPDAELTLEDGYGTPFQDYEVDTSTEGNVLLYRRADYLIETERGYRRAVVSVHDELALKHALMNFYASFIVTSGWGLLMHSSCAVEHGAAHLFAGPSGAGKSTAARLSHPRQILADEASLIKLASEEATVYDSPFRSEMEASGGPDCIRLGSIQLLHQSPINDRVPVDKAAAMVGLLDKVFYWPHDPSEAAAVFRLVGRLVARVPVYELYFERKNTFWELIRT